MANVIKTVITYPLNGSTRDFQIPFEYLARKFVQVTLIGRDRKALVNIQDYRFTSKTQITTNKTWGVGDGYELIELRRFTSATDRLVDFADGSILRAYDLNVSQIQTLHVAEEARDLTADTIGVNNEGHLDARGRRIVNVADPVNALDAVNLKTIKEWNDGAYQSYVKAKTEAEKAAASAAAAKVSQDGAEASRQASESAMRAAKVSQDGAEASRQVAVTSATNAANSAGSASSSAQQATAAKDYTKQQADRAYNEAERAKGYADSIGNAVDIGKVITEIDESTGRVTWNGSHFYKSKDGSNTYSEWTSPNGYQKAWLGAYDDGKVLLSAFHSGYGWSNIRIPTGESGYMATKEWVNKMVYLPNDSVTRLKSPNGSYVVQMENGGIYGFKDTVKDTYTFAFKSGEPFFYGTSTINLKGKNDWPGFSLYRVNGSHLRLEANPESSNILFNIVNRDTSGQNTHTFAIPTGNGTAATREWSNSQYVRKSPSYRKIWTGKFAKGNTITLSESIIGKVIAVKSYDRNRWETIHVLWAGSWATGAGGSVTMFTVSSNGRTLTNDYEAEYGYWTEIWVVE